MTERYYSSVAAATELTNGIDGSTLSIAVDAVTGFPNQFPYTLAVDFNTDNEELVDVTAAAGTTLTVTRGVDGTVGLAHEAGADVKHVITGRDVQDSRDHEEASMDVHGVGASSTVVGTLTTQTLEGKTIDGGDNTLQNVPQSAVTDLVDDQATQDGRLSTNEGNISSLTTQVSNHEAATNAHGVSTVAGVSEAQTLTNKTINSDDNTLDIGLGSLRRAILRKRLNSAGSIGSGVEAFGVSWTDDVNIGAFGGSGHSTQFTVPFTGLYLFTYQVQASWGGDSGGFELRFKSGMSSGSPTSGTVRRSHRIGMNDISQGGGSVHSARVFSDVVNLITGSTYGFTIDNQANASAVVTNESLATFYSVVYLGPAS